MLVIAGWPVETVAQDSTLPPVEVVEPSRPTSTRIARPTRVRAVVPRQAARAPAPANVERTRPATGTVLGSTPPAYAGGQVAQGGQVGLLGNKRYMDTPFSTVGFTAKTLQDQQSRSIAELLETNDAGVRSGSALGGLDDQFMIRGFRVLNQDVALNGLYGVAPFQRMLPYFIERVEVLKGPGALLNGMAPGGSVGGSINIVTKNAGDTPLTRLTTGYMSDANFGSHLDVARRWGVDKEFGARVNVGLRDGSTSIDRQSLRDGAGSLGLDYRGEKVRLSGDFYYQDQRINRVERPFLLAPGAQLPRPIAGINIALPDAYSHAQELGGMLRGEADLSPDVTVFGAFGGNRSRMNASATSQNLLLNSAGDVSADLGSRLTQNFDRTSGEAGIKGRFPTGPIDHELTMIANRVTQGVGFGFDLNFPGLTNLYTPVLNPPRVPLISVPVAPQSDLTMSSIAFADTMSILNKMVQLTVGVREQRVEVQNYASFFGPASSYDERALTPMVGAVFQPTRYLSLYTSYIEGLTQGGIAPFGTTNSGQALAPSASEQIEAGAKFDFGTIGGGISAFQIKQASAFTDPVTNTYVPNGRQTNRGIELTTFGQLQPDLRILGSALWLDAEQSRTVSGLFDGNRAVGTAKFYGNLGLEWDTPFMRGLTLSGRLTYTGSAYLDAANTTLVPDWHRFDIGSRYTTQLAGYRTVLRGDITNVTGENYWSVDGLGYLYIGAPRTYRLSMTIDF